MIKAIINLLFSVRKLFQKWGAKGFEKISDPETGKVKGISPQNLRRLIMTIIAIFFGGILVTQIFTGGRNLPSGSEEYQKEVSPKLGVGEQEQMYKSAFGEDPMSIAANRESDPLERLRGAGDGTDGVTLDDKGNPVPTMSECLDLIEKMKVGTSLSAEEQQKADVCIEKNIAGLSAEELAAAKALLEKERAGITGSKTDAEKELLKKLLNNELDPDGAEAKIAKGLASGDADAKAALAAMEAKNQELMDAFLAKMDGKQLSPEQQAMLDAYKKLMEDQAKAEGSKDGLNLTGKVDQDAKEMARKLAEEEERLKRLREEMAEAQAAAARAGEKISKGQQLSAAEMAALQKLADLQKRLAEQEAAQKKRREELAKQYAALQQALMQINKTVEQVYPSGISVEMDALADCKDVKPLKFKRIAKKGTGKGTKTSNKDVWLTLDGEQLTPDKIRLIKLMRKQKSDLDKAKQAALNPTGGDAGNDFLNGGRDSFGGTSQSLANSINAEETGQIEIGSLRIFTDKSLKGFNLTPDMKIPAVLDSDILVSDKGGGQSVRFRILSDIYNPETNQIVIPKGAIAVATAGGFDSEVGSMNINVDKVSFGGKVQAVKLAIGSADGSMGLRGQVRDTRGKYLLGAFITSFSAGALNWFSQQVVQPFQVETDAGNALTGAGLAGGAEVMNKIAEMYAGDLQNAAKIFYVPKGVPVIFFPE